MNIYHPYEVLSDTNDCLHLKEPEIRERIRFVIYRVLPLFLMLFMWFFIQQTGSEIPMGWNYMLTGSAILISAILFFHSYVAEFKIANEKIFLIQKNVKGSKEITIPLIEVEKIILKRRKGKKRGAFFTLRTKKGKSYELLNIPQFYLEEHHIPLIQERLQQMLMLT
jgi:DNA integrity scanning protein DisA with diadenylate cyclase activity